MKIAGTGLHWGMTGIISILNQSTFYDGAVKGVLEMTCKNAIGLVFLRERYR